MNGGFHCSKTYEKAYDETHPKSQSTASKDWSQYGYGKDLSHMIEQHRIMSKGKKSKHDKAYYSPSIDKKAAEKVRRWSSWSLTPHTEEEIREKCLTDFNDVCFSYVCETSKMSCDFIEELMCLSTGILTKDNYNDMYDKVHEVILKKNKVIDTDCEPWSINVSETNMINSITGYSSTNKKVKSSSVNDRLDWYAICIKQKLSEEFMRKFSHKLDWSIIGQNQSFSKEFEQEFYKKLHYVPPKKNGVAQKEIDESIKLSMEPDAN